MPRLLALLRRSFAQSARIVAVVLVLLTGFQVLLVVQAASLQQTQAFGRLAEMLPGYLQRGLGSMALLLASFKGAVTMGYFHPIIVMMMALLAIYLATEPAFEVERGMVDLLLSRPLPRHLLVTRSIVLSAGCAAAGGVSMGLGTWCGLLLAADRAWDWPTPAMLVQLVAHLTAVAWCFGAMGLAAAAGARRRSTPLALVGIAAAFLYLVVHLVLVWRPIRFLAWLSPFYYFPAVSILAGTAPRWSNLAILLSATLAFAALGYWRFARRDL